MCVACAGRPCFNVVSTIHQPRGAPESIVAIAYQRMVRKLPDSEFPYLSTAGEGGIGGEAFDEAFG